MPKSIVPISYPGGKAKMVKSVLSPVFPSFSGNFYDPFMGGGSIPLWVSQEHPNKDIYVNDLNKKLYTFWKVLKEHPEELIEKLIKIRKDANPKDIDIGKEMLSYFNEKIADESSTDLEIAASYFVLNKISFSGLTEQNSLSKHNYEHKFNELNINKLRIINSFMKNWRITNNDYGVALEGCSARDFIFLDPPYDLTNKKNNLYGKNGSLHEGFNHERFADVVKKLSSMWMITYNDTEKVRETFKDYEILDQEYTYYISFKEDEKGNKVSRKKNELIIINY